MLLGLASELHSAFEMSMAFCSCSVWVNVPGILAYGMDNALMQPGVLAACNE
jgi:hypothetical protein